MATMKDVAQLAQVSVSTVSAVMNNKHCVTEKTRRRVESSIEQLGYAKNPHAANLKSRKSNTIAVLIPNITSIFFPEILKGIERAAYDHGVSIIFCDTNRNIDVEKEYMRIMRNYWVRGIIVDTQADLLEDDEYRKFIVEDLIEANDTSVVLLESECADERIGSVAMDNLEGGRQCTNHLIEIGHKRIAHITGNTRLRFARARTEGYVRAHKEHDLVVDEALIVAGDFTPVSGYAAARQLLMEGREFTGIFVANDQMLVGAIKAFQESGLRVPDDVAAVGFDNTFVSSLVRPSLSTINVPRYRMGYRAVELITDEGLQPADRRVVLEGNLIVRQSSNPAASDSWDLYGW